MSRPTSHLELAPEGARLQTSGRPMIWPAPVQSDGITSTLSWNLHEYGSADPRALDVLRVAAAAYAADLTKARPADHVRDLTISVHVEQADAWTQTVRDDTVDLLAWLTGDIWTLDLIPATALVTGQTRGLAEVERVMLLSGGLDSLCGAVIGLHEAGNTLHIGHRDAARAVRHAQDQIRKALASANPAFEWQRDDLGVNTTKSERSTRSRSLLFMSMGVAAASARNAHQVIVPENGSTSVNYPLTPARSGALTTRSTHPFTFHMLNQILSGVGLDITVRNPYELVTKGHMLLRAAAAAEANGVSSFRNITGASLSCAKLDSGRYKGGNPNLNCGLCIACLVRRGSYTAADIADPTQYASQRLAGDNLAKLRHNRHSDLWAVEYAQKHDITRRDLVSVAPWPPGADLDAYLDVTQRGRKELFDAPRD